VFGRRLYKFVSVRDNCVVYEMRTINRIYANGFVRFFRNRTTPRYVFGRRENVLLLLLRYGDDEDCGGFTAAVAWRRRRRRRRRIEFQRRIVVRISHETVERTARTNYGTSRPSAGGRTKGRPRLTSIWWPDAAEKFKNRLVPNSTKSFVSIVDNYVRFKSIVVHIARARVLPVECI